MSKVNTSLIHAAVAITAAKDPQVGIEAALKAGFTEYKGGGGPNEKQVETNTRALGAGLKAMGLSVKFVMGDKMPFDIPDIGDSMEADETVVVIVGNKASIFDRWGFMTYTKGKSVDEGLDQGSLNDAIIYMSK